VPLLRRFGCELQGKYRFAAGVSNFYFPAVAGPQLPPISRSFSAAAVVASSHAASLSTSSNPSFLNGRGFGFEERLKLRNRGGIVDSQALTPNQTLDAIRKQGEEAGRTKTA
jgi:hypothetical protein